MMEPLPLPIHIYAEEEKCPKCNKPENIKNICAHCGYEYKEENNNIGFFDWFVIISIWAIVLSIVIWALVTIISWLTNSDTLTLFEVLKIEWRWITSLRIC